MGIVYKQTIHMYWSIDEIFSMPIFSEVMSRNRFALILKFLHFNDIILMLIMIHRMKTVIDYIQSVHYYTFCVNNVKRFGILVKFKCG